MIGLMFFFGLAVWLMLAVWISKRIVGWMGSSKFPLTRGITVFLIVLTAPVADDLIGRWQFHRLCEREAVVTLSPDWQKVKRAMWVDLPQKQIEGYVIPIETGGGEYIDVDTGQVFMRNRSFFARGGLLSRPLYLSGQGWICHPKNIRSINEQVNISELLNQGKKK